MVLGMNQLTVAFVRAVRKSREKEKAVASFNDPRPRAISSLEERVNALKNAVVSEVRLA